MKTLFYLAIYLPSLIIFWITKKTPKYMYIAQRRLFIETGGKFNDVFSSVISKVIGKYKITTSNGLFGEVTSSKAKEIALDIEENGYHIFNEKLPENLIADITKFSREQPAHIINLTKHVSISKEEFLIDENNIKSPKYSFNAKRLMGNKSIENISFDENLLHIAQEYLGVKPILDSISLWWSAPFGKKGTSAAAQEFHFDMDRIKFLKFFIYLTDVNEENGPHCYIPKSHKSVPKQLRKDGRFTDDLIESILGKHLEICKPKGTMMLVDTRGFHKGKPLTEGNRLLFQMEYTNTLVGQKIPKFPTKKINNPIAFTKYKRTFKLVKLS